MLPLLYVDYEIVLLTLLDEYVFPVYDILGADLTVNVPDLVLVKADSPALYHLAGLSFGREYGRLDCEKVQKTAGQFRRGKIEGRHASENGQEGLLIELAKSLGSRIAEKHARSGNSLVILLLAVAHDGNFACESLLQLALSGIGTVLLDQAFYGLTVQHGEYLYVTLGIFVAYVQPELVELVGGRLLGVEPDIAFLGLAELGAVGLADKRAGQCESLAAVHTADKFGAGGYIAPLVAAAKLENTVLVLPEPVEIVTLHELVTELGEGHALAGVAGKALLHGILGHHVVDGDMLSNVTYEIDE